MPQIRAPVKESARAGKRVPWQKLDPEPTLQRRGCLSSTLVAGLAAPRILCFMVED